MSSVASHTDVLWYSREKDATWLAAQLRSSRLTIVQGQSGSGKTTLLQWGLLARLRRRATDPVGPVTAPTTVLPDVHDDSGSAHDRKVVVPFPDRRRAPLARDTEVVVYMDSWSGAPLESLQVALHKALLVAAPIASDTPTVLVDSLARWHRQRGVRFLFVLDDFDECLRASTSSAGARDFVDQWVQAMGAPQATANFLVAMSEPAEPLWNLLARHLPQLGELSEHRLKLAGVSLVSPSREQPAEEPNELPSEEPSEPPTARLTEQLTEQPTRQPSARLTERPGADPLTASNTAAPIHRPITPMAAPPAPVQDRPEPPPILFNSDFGHGQLTSVFNEASGGAVVDTEANLAFAPPGQLPFGPTRGTGVKKRQRQRQADQNPLRTVLLTLAALALLAGVAFLAWDFIQPERPSAALPDLPVGSTQLGATEQGNTSLPAPGYELVADAGDSSDDLIGLQLAQLLTPQGRAAPTIRFPFGWSEQLNELSQQPRMALLTNDVLQAARSVRGGPQLQIVSPLFKEEIYFVVRSDSPLKYINQIRSSRIDAGPARGSRALVANGVYERMFGRPIPDRQLGTDGREEAVQKLLANKSSDVVVLVGAQPDPWLARLTAQARRGLRVLDLDPNSGATNRATAAYPVARITPATGSGIESPGGTRTLSTMTYLVAGDNRVAANDQPIRDAVTAMCANLPELQRTGHPRWLAVELGAPSNTGWPPSAAAAQALSKCPRRQ